MKEDPIKGDWIHLVKKGMMETNLDMSDEDIIKKSLHPHLGNLLKGSEIFSTYLT